MYIAGITKSDIVNGPGIRLSVFVSGCTNHCNGCFQPETWNFDYGEKYDNDLEQEIISELSKEQYRGITLLGGDPMEETNQEELLPLLLRIKSELPDKDIWAFTGFIYDRDLLVYGKRYYGEITDKLLDCIDVLVDGPFIINKKDIRLKFRGSTNQRIIDLKQSRQSNSIILWKQYEEELCKKNLSN